MHTERGGTSSEGDGRYRLLVEAISAYAIFMLDPDGLVMSWNPGAERAKGYRAEEVLGRHYAMFFTEEDRARGLPAKALATALAQRRFETEGWRVRKDGRRFWAQVTIDPVLSPEGTLIGYAKITRDLTERRAADEALRRSQEQFRLLVQGVTDYAIYMLDAGGRVSSWNSGAERIKGYTRDEVLGQHFSRFYTDEDRERGDPERALATALREGRYESEGWRVRKDGSRFWAMVVLDVLRDDNGRHIGFAKVTRDVTERRLAQRQLEDAREALFHAQKLDAIGQLTGGIAHDFNNLLAAVLASLELLRRRLPDDPKLAGLVDNAMRGARRGAALTQRMLAFARKQELHPAAVDVATLVHGLMDLLQRSLGPTIRITTDFAPDLPPALVDPNQLELALLNLAVNSRDAMPLGGQLKISGALQADAGVAARFVRVSVADDGQGMDESTLARATEPFFTTKGVGKGTGLGLSMVHGLAAQSGGRFALRSRLGAGTTAELWLPVAEDGAPAESGPLPAEPAQRREGPLVVLAVDDDALVLHSTSAMLRDMGHTVYEAGSAVDALALLQREPSIQLVLTDHAMPGMTGLQLATAVRERFPAIEVMLLTGYAEPMERVERTLPKLTKPFTREQLALAIGDRPA